MKEIIKTGIILSSALFLSACTLGFSGSDGGVVRSDDGGKSFVQKTTVDQNRNISGADALSIAVNPSNPAEVFLGTKSSGIFKSENGGESWKPLAFSQMPQKVYALAIDAQNPGNVFAAASLGKRGKIIRSEDGGESWRDVYTEPSVNTLVLALAVNPADSQRIFAGTEQGQILFSQDGGLTWRNMHWAENRGAVYKIAYDNANTGIAYFAVLGEGILRTTDEGSNFQKLSRAPQDSFALSRDLAGVTSLVTDPERGGWLYAGLPEGLLRSRDAGDSWETVRTLNKPEKETIRSIAINPANSDEIICGVSQAFYKSVDGGVNWLPVQFDSRRTIEVLAYNKQNPAQIFAGMNKR